MLMFSFAKNLVLFLLEDVIIGVENSEFRGSDCVSSIMLIFSFVPNN